MKRIMLLPSGNQHEQLKQDGRNLPLLIIAGKVIWNYYEVKAGEK